MDEQTKTVISELAGTLENIRKVINFRFDQGISMLPKQDVIEIKSWIDEMVDDIHCKVINECKKATK